MLEIEGIIRYLRTGFGVLFVHVDVLLQVYVCVDVFVFLVHVYAYAVMSLCMCVKVLHASVCVFFCVPAVNVLMFGPVFVSMAMYMHIAYVMYISRKPLQL